jgi:predicted nucleotidyltransferase
MQRRRNNTTGDARDGENRRRIAVEAARLISEQGIRDYLLAKRKAAGRLGIFADSAMPKNSEIEDALREHQRLFEADQQPLQLRRLREAAREALRFFAGFEPRLVGAVLDGSADRHSSVCLHLFSDEPEAVLRVLDEHGVPYEEHGRRLRLARDAEQEFPALVFSAGGVPIDATVLPTSRLRQPPLDRSGEKPMQRANLAALDALIDAPGNPAQRLPGAT